MNSLYRLYRKDFLETLRLAGPIALAQLGVVMMGVIDNVMVGRIGAASLAASGISNSVFFLVAVIGIGATQMLAPLISSDKNSTEPSNCGLQLKNGLWASLIMCVGIMVIIELTAQHFDLFGQTPEITQLSISFMRILNYGSIPLLLFLTLRQFTDGLSETKYAAITTFIGLGSNIILNWILIYGNLGMPALGLNGAGIATGISRVIMALTMGWYVFRPKFRMYRTGLNKPADLNSIFRLLKIGIPAGMQYFFEIAAFSGAAIMIGWLGKFSLAAHQVAISSAAVTYMLASGISTAGSIRVGDAHGRKNALQVRKAGFSAIILGSFFMGICALFFTCMHTIIPYWYVSDNQVAEIASTLLIIAALFQLSDGIQVIGLGILRGIMDVRFPTLITLISYWAIGIPVGYVLCFTLGLGASGMWIGLLLGLTCSAILLTYRFIKLSSKPYPLF